MYKKYYFRSLFCLILGFVLLFGNVFSVEAKQMTNIDFNKNILNSTDYTVDDFPLPIEYAFAGCFLLLGGSFSYTVDYDEGGYQCLRTVESVNTEFMSDSDRGSWDQENWTYYFSPDCKTVYITVYGWLTDKDRFLNGVTLWVEHTFSVCPFGN